MMQPLVITTDDMDRVTRSGGTLIVGGLNDCGHTTYTANEILHPASGIDASGMRFVDGRYTGEAIACPTCHAAIECQYGDRLVIHYSDPARVHKVGCLACGCWVWLERAT